MSGDLMVGIDTGGTYTDAVLVTDDEHPTIVATAKALTSHHDIAIGIGQAMDAVTGGVDPAAISLVSVSTTLATNAIVEGHGGRVCLITMGFDPIDLASSGVDRAVGDGLSVTISGGHNSHGDELAPLDLDELDRALDAVDTDHLSGFAVASQFAVRNPRHEQRVRDHLRARFDCGVSCSHELTAKLNGPKRAVTAVLNARLIGLITGLVAATRSTMTTIGIEAPLMVVRGDGSLISAELAAERPIETILSGPAASVIGAKHLTDAADAIVADIGGTTTDIAVMTDGRVELDRNGSLVGGHATMVEAVAMRTFGLGGDSEVSVDDSGPSTSIVLGPRRSIPLALLGAEYPDRVLPVLEAQLRAGTTPWLAGSFALLRHRPPEGFVPDDREGHVLDGLADGPAALRELLPTKRHEIALDRLVSAGFVSRSGFTPTDAAHVLGLHREWSVEAATAGAALFARTQDRRGAAVALDGTVLAETTIATLQERTARSLLTAALDSDGFDPDASTHPLAEAGLDHHRGRVAVDLRLTSPIVGLGASAPTYYPAVAARLGTELLRSEHAGVANAVGAIVGEIRVTRTTTITRKKNGTYMAVGQAFDELGDAASAAAAHVTSEVSDLAARAGATTPRVDVERADNIVDIDGQDFFVDSTITATGRGRPQRR